jgi:predicted permease
VLRGARTGAARHRLREGLLVVQVSLSVLLLIGAGLFVRSFAALSATELGFDEENVVTLAVDLPRQRYDTPQQTAFYDRLLERMRAMPGVLAATGTSLPPGGGNEMSFSFAIENRPAQSATGREDPEILHAIGTDYFTTLGQRVLHGRAFDERDRADSPPVAIVNATLARKHWPTENPVGQRISFRPGDTPWLEIVGVVDDVRFVSPDTEPVPAVYMPYAQRTWPWLTWMTLLARVPADTDPAVVQSSLRNVLLELDRGLPPQSISTVEQAFGENLARRSFALTLVGGFGAIALLLSVIGVYGLLAYTVAQRTREIGVRVAIGARPTGIVRGVLVHSLTLALLGAVFGVLAAIVASRTVESLLYGVSRLDAATYAATVLLVVCVALAAAALPAWRAAHVSPLQALRSD